MQLNKLMLKKKMDQENKIILKIYMKNSILNELIFEGAFGTLFCTFALFLKQINHNQLTQ